jgi:hypothetical protein
MMLRQLVIGIYYQLTRRHIQEEQNPQLCRCKNLKIAQYARFSISPALVDLHMHILFLEISMVIGLVSVYWINDRVCQILGYFKFIILVGYVKLR